MEAKLIKEKDRRFHLWLNIGTKDAEHIASNEPLMGEWGRDLLKYKLSLKNCQEIERGYDSLQQTEWDVEIEMEQVYDGLDEMAQPQYYKQPKLDADGCLILKRI